MGDAQTPANVTLVPLFRPSAYVCQRCLRLLDMLPLCSEMALVDLDSFFEGDLLKHLEPNEQNKNRIPFSNTPDLHSRSHSLAVLDTRSIHGPSTYSAAPGALMATRVSTGTNRKKKGDAVISRTLTSFTNFFKSSGSTTTVSPNSVSTATVVPSPPGASAPKPAASSVPSHSSSEGSGHQSGIIEDDDLAVPREEYDAEYDSGLIAGAGSAAATHAAVASSTSPTPTQLSRESGSPHQMHYEEDDGWVTSFSPPSLATSVSRAIMREKSTGPALMPTPRRVKRQQYQTLNNSSDFLAKRQSSTRDLVSLGASNPSISSPSLNSSQSLPKSAMRKAGLLVAQATIETEIDFPLCVECSHDVLDDLEDEEYELDSQIEAYEQELAFTSHPYFETEDFAEEVPLLERKIVDRGHDMQLMQQKIVETVAGTHALKTTERELILNKAEYWRQFEIHAADREAMLENTISAHNRLTHATKWLDMIRASHVVNDAFPVSVDLHLGSIGGLRLGRLPSAPVDWPEISAAFGLVVQLLHELALRASFAFSKYRLVLDGSFSGIQRAHNNTTLPLHSDGDISLVRLVQFKSINDAVAALTECIAELAAHLKGQYPSFLLPFTIIKDLVAGVSIKRAWNSTGASWSTALRSLLANLKYMLAFEAKNGLCV